MIKRPLDSGITINTALSDQYGSFSSQGGFLFYSNNPEDLVYYKDNLAAGYAQLDGITNGCRGEGSSYQNKLTFDPVTMNDHNYFTYKISSSNDSLHGTDLVKITDYGNSKKTVSGKIKYTNFGQID